VEKGLAQKILGSAKDQLDEEEREDMEDEGYCFEFDSVFLISSQSIQKIWKGKIGAQ
jgi:hypothetical protein